MDKNRRENSLFSCLFLYRSRKTDCFPVCYTKIDRKTDWLAMGIFPALFLSNVALQWIPRAVFFSLETRKYIFWATCISHWQTLMVFRSILSGYAPRPRCFLPMSPGKMCFWVLSLLIIPPQCEMLSKSTRVEVLVMAKQWGSTQAFLFFWTRCWTKLGLASTRRPVH